MRSIIRQLALVALALGITAGAAFAREARGAAAPGSTTAVASRATTPARPHPGARPGGQREAAARGAHGAPARAPARHVPHRTHGTRPHSRSLRRTHRDGQRFATLAGFRAPLAAPVRRAAALPANPDRTSLTPLREAGRGPPRTSPDPDDPSPDFARPHPTPARRPFGPDPNTIAIGFAPAALRARRVRARARCPGRAAGRVPVSRARPRTPSARPGGAPERVMDPPLGGIPMSRRLSFAAPVFGALLLASPIVAFAGSPAPSAPAPGKPAAVATTPASKAAAPAKSATATHARAASAAMRVDLNSASREELEKLPGIGEAIATSIVAGRPYKEKRDLLTRGLVNKTEYAKLAPHVIAKQAAAEPAKP